MRDNDDRRQVVLRFYLQPVDLNKSLALQRSQAAQCPAVGAMDDDPFIRIEESGDCVAGQRAAAMGKPDNGLWRFTVPMAAVGMVSIFNRLRLLLHLATVLQERCQMFKHRPNRQVLSPKSHVQVIGRGVLLIAIEARQVFISHDSHAGYPRGFQCQVKPFAAQLQVDFSLIGIQVPANFRARARRTREVEPFARRMYRLVCNDIDDLTALEFIIQRHDACHQASAIVLSSNDARAGTVIADIRMNAIRQIERSRASWQVFDLTLGRKNENLLLEYISLDGLHKLIRVLWQAALPLAQLLNPGNHFTG